MLDISSFVRRRDDARRAAHAVLEEHEASESRILVLRDSFERLSGLPVDIAEYYRESLKALQVGCYRAAIVMAWAGFISSLTESMVVRHGGALAANYQKWSIGSAKELLDSVPEAQILEAAKKVGVIGNQRLNIYKGWLSTRNQCAHPTVFRPTRNVALGFVDALVSEVSTYA